MNGATPTPTGGTTRTARLTFFSVSGPLPPDRPGYIERTVDDVVLQAMRDGRLLNIVGAPQSGKTSLMLRCTTVLRNEDNGPLVAFIDLRQLAERDSTQDVARWFYSIAYRIVRQLRASLDLQTWWADNAMLPLHLRLLELYRELLLLFPGRAIVMLFDDVHLLNAHADGDALLASFRALADARSADPTLNQISIGFCSDGADQLDLRESSRMPFGVAQNCVIENLSLQQTLSLSPALGLARDQAELAMQRIYDWVAGHPALTQTLAADVAALPEIGSNVAETVDQLVQQRFGSASRATGHSALAAIERAIVRAREPLREEMLITLGRLAKRGRVLFDPAARAHDRLLALGAVQLAPDGFLIASSRLLRRFLNAAWANKHLPTRMGGVIKAAVVIALCIALPVWYRLLLPRPYMAALMAPDATPAALVETTDRLSLWPGYARHARRVLKMRMQQLLVDVDTSSAFDAHMAPLRESGRYDALVREWSAQFWQRQLQSAERRGERAAAIDALVHQLAFEDAASLRSKLAALVGNDLRALSSVLHTDEPFDDVFYRPLDNALLVRSGLRLDEWLPKQSRRDWQLQRSFLPQALRFSPAVVTTRLSAITDARNLAISVDVAHERPSDIALQITLPDGRSASFAMADVVADLPSVTIRLGDIDGLRGRLARVPAGEWTFSFVDQRPGMLGKIELIAPLDTELQKSQSVGLPDPTTVAPSGLHVTPGARFAIALPSGADTRAAIWDLRRRRLVASLPLSADARLLGFGDAARVAYFIDGVTIRAYHLGDGAPVPRAVLTTPQQNGWLSKNGRWLLAQSVSDAAQLRLVDLQADSVASTFSVGDDIRAVAIAADGRHIAVVSGDHVVRIWNSNTRQLATAFDAGRAVRDMQFLDDGGHLLARGVGGGLFSWDFQSGQDSVRWDEGVEFSIAVDKQSGLSLVGSSSAGYRVHDFASRRDLSLPFFGFASDDQRAVILRLRENLAITASPESGNVTVWRPALEALPTSQQRVAAAWLSDDANRIAFVDGEQRYNVLRTDAGVEELDILDASVSTLQHATRPEIVRFSAGNDVLSVERNGLFRVYDNATGEFRRYLGRAGSAVSDAAFDATAQLIAFARGQSIGVHATQTGANILRHDFDSAITAISTAPDKRTWLVFLNNGDVFECSLGQTEIEQLRVTLVLRLSLQTQHAASNQLGLTVVAAGNALQVFDRRRRELLGLPAVFSGRISQMRFSPDGRYLVLRSGQWLHRLRVDAWEARIDASRLLPADMAAHRGFGFTDRAGSGVVMLAGLDEPVPRALWFDHRDVAPVTGSASVLADRWSVVRSFVHR